MVEAEVQIVDAKADLIVEAKVVAIQARAVDTQDAVAKVAATQAKAVDMQDAAAKVAATQAKAADMQDVAAKVVAAKVAATKVAAIPVKIVDTQDVPHLSRNADTLAKAKAVATKDNSMREVATLKLSKF